MRLCARQSDDGDDVDDAIAFYPKKNKLTHRQGFYLENVYEYAHMEFGVWCSIFDFNECSTSLLELLWEMFLIESNFITTATGLFGMQ